MNLCKRINHPSHPPSDYKDTIGKGDPETPNFRLRSFLICRSEESADACAVLVSLVKCAEANGLYPDMYIDRCLERIRDGADPSSLMPWAKECEGFPIPDAAKRKK